MLAALTLMTAMMVGPADYTVVDVEIKLVFAGRFGNRIKTELTVERNGRQVRIFIQDRRHDKFQSAEAKWETGDMVSLLNLDGKSKAYLLPGQIKQSPLERPAVDESDGVLHAVAPVRG